VVKAACPTFWPDRRQFYHFYFQCQQSLITYHPQGAEQPWGEIHGRSNRFFSEKSRLALYSRENKCRSIMWPSSGLHTMYVISFMPKMGLFTNGNTRSIYC
jgi:hypothetical protein